MNDALARALEPQCAAAGVGIDVVEPLARRILGDEWGVPGEAGEGAVVLAATLAVWEAAGGVERLRVECRRRCPQHADDALSQTLWRVRCLLRRAARGEADIDLRRGAAAQPVENLHGLHRRHLDWVARDLTGPGPLPGQDDGPGAAVAEVSALARAELRTPAAWGAAVWVWPLFRERLGRSFRRWLAERIARVWGGGGGELGGPHGGAPESVLRRDLEQLLAVRVDYLCGLGRWWEDRCTRIVGDGPPPAPHLAPDRVVHDVIRALAGEAVRASTTLAIPRWVGLPRSQRRPLVRLLSHHSNGRPYRVEAMLPYFGGADDAERLATLGELMEHLGVRTRRALEGGSMGDGSPPCGHAPERRALRGGRDARTRALALERVSGCPDCLAWWEARTAVAAWARSVPLPPPPPSASPLLAGGLGLLAAGAVAALWLALRPPAPVPDTLALGAVHAGLLVRVEGPDGTAVEVPLLADEPALTLTAARGSRVDVRVEDPLLRDEAFADATLRVWAVTEDGAVAELAREALTAGPDGRAVVGHRLPSVGFDGRALRVAVRITPAASDAAPVDVTWESPAGTLPEAAWVRIVEVDPR